MIIPEVKLTEEEMREAVHAYLVVHGISIPVESVEKSYSGRGAWRVAFSDPEETKPPTAEPLADDAGKEQAV